MQKQSRKQVKHVRNALFWKAQRSKRRERPTQRRNKPSPPQHRGPGPARSQPGKGGGGRATPGTHAPRVRPRPPLCQVGPASAGGAVIKRRLAVRGALGEYSPRMPPPRSYIKRGRLPPYTHTHHTSLTLAQVSSSLPPPLLT